MNSNRKTIAQIISICAIILIFCGNLCAQKIEGIYLSAKDFHNQNISFKSKKKTKIKLYDSFYKPYIKVKHNDSTFILHKDSIFGYKNFEGNSFRFSNKLIYQILNPNETITLYKIDKTTGSTKEPHTITNYYFSTNANNSIFPLTIQNLENAFKENNTFKEFLEIHFTKDADLVEYDDKHNTYKIIRLLELSISHKNN